MSEEQFNKHSHEEQLQAAYALNMCTVSISQIIDYNDIYILEQEYEAILNNLNLEKMPKDEALLTILTEILNTISFFRIQELKKDQIEKKYQNDLRSAIWRAVPNLSVVVSGNPVSMSLSIATQVGIGYMNYRNAKAQAKSEKDAKEMEIQIAAMEQFHALRRELFTTSWRLADEYQFPDEYRLTERQIKQYNEILMDNDDFRKYDRLCDIADKFEAYPPFWYYLGHTANSIVFSDKASSEQKDFYAGEANKYFEKYYEMCRFNLLREDQMVASYALEYVDLLMSKGNDNMTQEEKNKLHELISLAVKMSGNANDTLELSAIAYMKIGDTAEAEGLLRHLVNENYNAVTNAKLLSRFYVSDYITGDTKDKKLTAASYYETLTYRVDRDYLFPMPRSEEEQTSENGNVLLEETYSKRLNRILRDQYNTLVVEISDKYKERFSALLPDDNRWEANSKECMEILRTGDFRSKGLSLLNEMIDAMDSINMFANSPIRDTCIGIIRGNIIISNKKLKELLDKLKDNSFKKEDLKTLRQIFSFDAYTEKFFERATKVISDALNNMTDMENLDEADLNITRVCQQEDLPLPSAPSSRDLQKGDNTSDENTKKCELPGTLFGIDVEKEKRIKEARDAMSGKVKKYRSKIIKNPEEVNLLIKGEDLFNTYFENRDLTRSEIKDMTVAVIDDTTKRDSDFVLDFYGIRTIIGNKVSRFCPYKDVSVTKSKGATVIKLPWWMTSYSNKAVDIEELYQLIMELKKDSLNLEKLEDYDE